MNDGDLYVGILRAVLIGAGLVVEGDESIEELEEAVTYVAEYHNARR